MEGVGTLSWLSAEAVLLKWGHPAGSPMQTGMLSTCSWATSTSVAIIQNNGSLGPIRRFTEEGKEVEMGGTGAERTITECEGEVGVNVQHTHHTHVHTVRSCTH